MTVRKFTLLLAALGCAAPRAGGPAASSEDAAAALPAASPAAPPSAEGGAWRAARWGMTVEEVLRAFPGEATRIEPELRLADGAVVAAGIDAQEIASHRLRVRFVFEGGRLSLVSLRTPPDAYATPDVYRELAKALEERYGPPLEATGDAELIDLRQTRWIAGGSGVDLKYIPGVVAIVHYPRPAPPRVAAPPSASGR